jgi:hypothetical protein
VKAEEVLGAHGAVLEVGDPEREARLWRRALGLPVLRRSRDEIVLGSVAFFVVLRRGGPRGGRVAELHVAVDKLSGAGVRRDALGGRSRERDVDGVKLVVRELAGPPSKSWLPKKRRAARKSRGE